MAKMGRRNKNLNDGVSNGSEIVCLKIDRYSVVATNTNTMCQMWQINVEFSMLDAADGRFHPSVSRITMHTAYMYISYIYCRVHINYFILN